MSDECTTERRSPLICDEVISPSSPGIPDQSKILSAELASNRPALSLHIDAGLHGLGVNEVWMAEHVSGKKRMTVERGHRRPICFTV